MNLCLGTVQFGMNYGICGQKRPSIDESINMLDYAVHNGITHIDTARQYGNAEEIVGIFLKKKKIPRGELFISTKLRPNILDNIAKEEYSKIIRNELKNQLKILGVDYIDVYLLHTARYVYDADIIEALNSVKKDGLARYVGVSVYETDEAKCGIEAKNVDYLQLPFSLFDQRMLNSGIFERAENNKDTIIDSRSAFIQGLILMSENQVPDFLCKAKPLIRKIDELCKKYNISRIALAMNYVKKENAIHSLVFGVDNMEQLKENIICFYKEIDKELMKEIANQFKEIEAEIVMPSLWVKK